MQQAPQEPKNGMSDQALKQRIVLITALLALVGFALEVGPVGGAFQLTGTGFAIELPYLGFLAYLALAASAAVGLHFFETEPRPKEPPPESGDVKPTPNGGAVRERAAVRPELHQFVMFLTALGGYLILKGLSFVFMWPYARQQFGVEPGTLLEAFRFGFFYVAVAWFVLWQFLRWIAIRQRWIRLQQELVGGDVAQMIAVLILVVPLYFVIRSIMQGQLGAGPQNALALLLHLSLAGISYFLWTARPVNLRRTVIGLLSCGGVIVVLSIILVLVERAYVG